ncbi:MAG: hypothetical protein RIQ88_709 [Actinomycetota bacterium]
MITPAQVFASHLIAQLATFETQFWLAPGSRSQALAIAADSVSKVSNSKLHVRIDERSLAFHALGAAISGKLQAIITTSGTAVANLHPAVLEAHHSGIPLILLTADRPSELRDKGANQTTYQRNIFGKAVIKSFDVQAPKESDLESLPLKAKDLVSEIVALAVQNSQPIHINLQFTEPLSSATPDAGEIYQTLEPKELPKRLDQYLQVDHAPETIIIAGANADEFHKEITSSDLPVFAEPNSGLRGENSSIASYRHLLSSNHPLLSEIKEIFVYGKPTLSRDILKLIANPHIKVSSRLGKMGRFQMPGVSKVYSNQLGLKGTLEWRDRWLEAEENLEISDVLNRAKIVEVAFRREDAVLVFGASQMIREADLIAVKSRTKVWANRGLAGIDGTIATASGIALSKGKTRAIIGDLTFLHDVGSLVIVEPLDLQVVVVNDNGGKIFAGLGLNKQLGRESYQKLFQTPQRFNVEDLAKAFAWRYVLASTVEEYVAALDLSGQVLIEVKLDS